MHFTMSTDCIGNNQSNQELYSAIAHDSQMTGSGIEAATMWAFPLPLTLNKSKEKLLAVASATSSGNEYFIYNLNESCAG